MAAMLLVPLAGVLVARALVPALPLLPAPSASPAARHEPVPPPVDDHPAIRGRILDADGRAVEGANVRLVSLGAPATVQRDIKSDAAGRFSFAHVGYERARVLADHDPDGAVQSAGFTLTEGKTIEITLVLSPATVVRGTVVDAEDHPVAGATLSIESAPWTVRTATSDETGAFRLAMIPEEATVLVAVAAGYRTARLSLAHRTDPAELVVQVRLVAAAPAEGDVLDADGKPVRARVVACEGQPAEARVESAEDGTFRLPPASIGCNAVAQHDEYASSDAVAVTEGRRIVLQLRPGGAIEGAVVDSRGTAVTPFALGIVSFSAATRRGGGGQRKIEDPRGAFRWDKLAPGNYVLTAAAAGRPPTRSEPIEVRAGAATTGVRIVVLQGGSIAGRVVDERHAPLAGVDLRFDAVSAVVESSAVAKTDEGGRYRLDGAPEGPLTLRVQKDGFRIRMLSGLRVDSGRTLAQDVTLTAVDGGPGLEFGGIGASLAQTREGITFGNVFPGDPADRAGLHAGDRILRIDGEETEGMSVVDILQRLRGEVGTSLGVSVQRPNTGETFDVTFPRGTILR